MSRERVLQLTEQIEKGSAAQKPALLAELAAMEKAGDGDAAQSLAVLYWEGVYVPSNKAKAITLFERGVALGNGRSMSSLGTRHLEANGVAKNITRGLALLHKGAEQKSPECEIVLARWFSRGPKEARDFEAARRWFERAAASAERDVAVMAASELGDLYLNKELPDPQKTKAGIWYEKAMALGHKDVAAHLAYWRVRGAIAEAAPGQGLKALSTLVASNHPLACFNLGELYAFGRIPSKAQHQDALRAYLTAAQGGNLMAKGRLASLYYSKDKGLTNYDEAARWARAAADGGNAQGMEILGLLHSHGRGVPQSDSQAIEWWKKATAAGQDCSALIANIRKVADLEIAKFSYSQDPAPSERMPRPPLTNYTGTCRWCSRHFGKGAGDEGGFCSYKCFSEFHGEA